MKNILFMFLTFLIIGCETEQGKGKTYKYSIENKSGKNITINSYRTVYPKRILPIVTQLNNGQTITKTFEDTLPPSGYDFGVFFNGDSLVVNYNNEKKQIYSMFKEEDDKGPFLHTGTLENFIFSEADYNNAIPCNGNCD